jgi:hypothetical protein
LDWKPQGVGVRGRPKQTIKKTVLEEAIKWGKTWREVKRLAGNRVRWRCSTNSSAFLMERKNVLPRITIRQN